MVSLERLYNSFIDNQEKLSKVVMMQGGQNSQYDKGYYMWHLFYDDHGKFLLFLSMYNINSNLYLAQISILNMESLTASSFPSLFSFCLSLLTDVLVLIPFLPNAFISTERRLIRVFSSSVYPAILDFLSLFFMMIFLLCLEILFFLIFWESTVSGLNHPWCIHHQWIFKFWRAMILKRSHPCWLVQLCRLSWWNLSWIWGGKVLFNLFHEFFSISILLFVVLRTLSYFLLSHRGFSCSRFVISCNFVADPSTKLSIGCLTATHYQPHDISPSGKIFEPQLLANGYPLSMTTS